MPVKFVQATCPACGGSLEVAENLASASCPYCAAKIILDWGGQVSLAVHLELGKTFLQAGNYQEAYEHFSRALEKNPRSGDAWFWKGIAAAMMGKFTEALAYLKRSTFSPEETISNLVKIMETRSPKAYYGADLAAQMAREAHKKEISTRQKSSSRERMSYIGNIILMVLHTGE